MCRPVYLVSEWEIVPEDDDLLLGVVVSLVRTVGGDGDTLPLGAPVLDTIQRHHWLSLTVTEDNDTTTSVPGTDLKDVVEHGQSVSVHGLRLPRLEPDQAGPGVVDVGAVPPLHLVLLVRHLETQRGPAGPGLPCTVNIRDSSSINIINVIFNVISIIAIIIINNNKNVIIIMLSLSQ